MIISAFAWARSMRACQNGFKARLRNTKKKILMSRWRPPTEKSSPYITAKGYIDLQSELDQLWKTRRVVNNALAAAAAEGDRSENAEYIYRKKEQAGIDRRIRYIQKRLPDLKVIDQVGANDQIYFGATVVIENDQGAEKTIRIVGPDETNTHSGDISIDSPLARALLKKRVDDETSITVNGKQSNYIVLAISYHF